ncbi:hypothetical protein U1Q18_013264, partial [Sarracenia purpurea var. burkii]
MISPLHRNLRSLRASLRLQLHRKKKSEGRLDRRLWKRNTAAAAGATPCVAWHLLLCAFKPRNLHRIISKTFKNFIFFDSPNFSLEVKGQASTDNVPSATPLSLLRCPPSLETYTLRHRNPLVGFVPITHHGFESST